MNAPMADASSTDKTSAEVTIALLIDSLTAVPEYTSPFIPIYEALADAQPLTLRALRTHSHLLRGCTDLARDETSAIHQVIVSCKQIPPTPLPALPLGF